MNKKNNQKIKIKTDDEGDKMPSCLGLFIENDLIKYAKVTKERNVTKVEAFGIRFYDKLNEAIKQIISETYSYKIPISINLSEEMYNYFYMFSLLNKNDIKKAIATEFESYCADKGFNINALEGRYIFGENTVDSEKLKVIHVSANKTEIIRKEQSLEGNNITNISPVPMIISNLINQKETANIAVVNLESKTTVTLLVNNKISHVYNINKGTEDILKKIRETENSYSKAYEVCKQSTIYTLEGKELQNDANDYLEQIMPTLYDIVSEVKKIIEQNLEKIDKIYITGTASVINNIDLYFQEYMGDIQCEILKPYFINKEVVSINIKDYIEVNSAISLALQGLGEGIKEMNFKNSTMLDGLLNSVNIGNFTDVFKGKNPVKGTNKKFNMSLSGALTTTEKNLLRFGTSILTIIVMYIIFSTFVSSQIQAKQKEVDEVISNTEIEISKVNSDITNLQSRVLKYTEMRENLENINEQITERYSIKNAIPNLLNKIMFMIPQEVKLTSIQNTSEKNIEIKAESSQYEQLGYFKAKLKTDAILINVTSDSGVKQDGIVKVTIKGELP